MPERDCIPFLQRFGGVYYPAISAFGGVKKTAEWLGKDMKYPFGGSLAVTLERKSAMKHNNLLLRAWALFLKANPYNCLCARKNAMTGMAMAFCVKAAVAFPSVRILCERLADV